MPTPTVRFLCNTCNESVTVSLYPTDTTVRCAACGQTYASEDGILLLGSGQNEQDYPDEAYELLAKVEPRHFWFNGRNRLILSTMREIIGPLAGLRVLDIGCGTGFVLAELEQAGMITCGPRYAHGRPSLRAQAHPRTVALRDGNSHTVQRPVRRCYAVRCY